MAQFGWGALVKTAILSVVVTSGVWLVAGMAYYEREWGRPAARMAANGEPVQTADYLPQPPSGGPPEAAAIALTARTPPVSGQTVGATSLASGNLTIPVAGTQAGQLVDTFADSRSDGRVHDAIDIMAPRGTAVVAAAAGTVEKLFTSKQGGLTLYLRSPDRRVVYYYAHLDSYAPGLAEGQRIAAGAPLGFVGSTGNASPDAPHLHFAILVTTPEANWSDPATAVNPYALLGGKH